jgi:hypothetical protein
MPKHELRRSQGQHNASWMSWKTLSTSRVKISLPCNSNKWRYTQKYRQNKLKRAFISQVKLNLEKKDRNSWHERQTPTFRIFILGHWHSCWLLSRCHFNENWNFSDQHQFIYSMVKKPSPTESKRFRKYLCKHQVYPARPQTRRWLNILNKLISPINWYTRINYTCSCMSLMSKSEFFKVPKRSSIGLL